MLMKKYCKPQKAPKVKHEGTPGNSLGPFVTSAGPSWFNLKN